MHHDALTFDSAVLSCCQTFTPSNRYELTQEQLQEAEAAYEQIAAAAQVSCPSAAANILPPDIDVLGKLQSTSFMLHIEVYLGLDVALVSSGEASGGLVSQQHSTAWMWEQQHWTLCHQLETTG